MYARYDGTGKIIPGSNIWAKKAPALGNWVEVTAYECCNATTTTTTTAGELPCMTYGAIVSRGVALVIYTDCEGEMAEIECFPGITQFCALLGQFTVLGQAGVYVVGEGCLVTTTTTTTTEPCIVLGYLFNWWAATSDKGIASDGWHLPSKAEYVTLGTYLGGVLTAGGHLKESGTTYWDSPNTGADNSSGFNGRGSGYIDSGTGNFSAKNEAMEIWTTDESPINPVTHANAMFMTYMTAELTTGGYYPKTDGAAIRLIKDDDTLDSYVGNDGKLYSTVKIGTQVWLAENLTETKYADGDTITQVTDPSAWVDLETGAASPYNGDYDNAENCATTTTTTTAAPTTTTTTTQPEVPSDVRLKKNIKPTGGNVGIFREYTWEWNEKAIELGFANQPTKGVLAQEVLAKKPVAVVVENGWLKVNYDLIR